MGKGQRLYEKASRLIPGGTQLLSKRPEMFLPGGWPAYYSKAKGTDVWDLDGKKYTDMSYSGIGACVLGYADPDVDRAVRRAVAQGTMSTLNCPEEVELAELLLSLHPWAGMVRFARCGGEAMGVAVRIARAATGKDRVAFCGYHGWHDWYLSANLTDEKALDGHLLPGLDPAGVPRALAGTAFPFSYNRLDQLEEIVAAHGASLGAIVLEPVRSSAPAEGFLEKVKEIAGRIGAVLVFDEVTSGWRLNTGGVHLLYGVTPDVAVFAKGMSNGYPMAAVIGKPEVMSAAKRSFISSTYCTERIGPTAALAMIRKHRKFRVGDRLRDLGRQILDGWVSAAVKTNLSIHTDGIPPLAHFAFDHPKPQLLKTLFTKLMLKKGFLATTAFYANFAQKQTHVRRYLEAVEESFSSIAEASAADRLEERLGGPVAHTGFRRLT